MKPTTRYAKSGANNIAYQVLGEGPVDLVYVPGWVSNIDMMWVDPKISDFLIRLTQFSRVIVFDKRGTGLSDRVNPLCSLEERIADVVSVMDAAGSQKAILFGHSEGGTISCLFAATYPERTISLITFGVFAKRKYSDDYPWAPTPAVRKIFYDSIQKEWGNGQKMGLECIMPSMAHDKEYYNVFASYLRSGAGPGDALALAKMNTDSDITSILHTITVPTLIIHRVDDTDVNKEEARYLAHRIPNAQLELLHGNDHCFWVGDAFSVLAKLQEFVTGKRPTKYDVPINRVHFHCSKIDIESTMLQNFKYHLKMEEYATLCGRSVSVYKRDFKEHFATTPFHWLKTKRLEYAQQLLLESDLNINQICYESGFVNVSHFVRAFKEAFHMPPLQFKKIHMN